MIRLHPTPDAVFDCPICKVRLQPRGWLMPGMRVLADLTCLQCGRRFYGDMPTGQGLLQPALTDQADGTVYSDFQTWFADELRDGYAHRVAEPLEISVEALRPLRNPAVLNCLDSFYGHCLEKLLNLQHYIDEGVDVLVIVPTFLRWLVPDGAAEIWSVNIPLRQGNQWNDAFAAQIAARLAELDGCALAVAFPEPHPGDYQIERFTRVTPFPLDQWTARPPAVTLIWREDRLWADIPRQRWRRGVLKVGRRLGVIPSALAEQTIRLCHLIEALTDVDLAVVGLGSPGGLPPHVNDLRTKNISETIERQWCERYAASHVVVGIHGSNMLLPSALAGAVVELLPPDRFGNLGQDIIYNGEPTGRDLLYRCRFLPLSASPSEVAEMIKSVIRFTAYGMLHFQREWTRHSTIEADAIPLSMRYRAALEFIRNVR